MRRKFVWDNLCDIYINNENMIDSLISRLKSSDEKFIKNVF